MKSSNFICTIGPSNNTPERIERMISKGMSVGRLNLSYGSLEDHSKSIQNLRVAADRFEARTKVFCPVAVAVDLRGPEIRTGSVEATSVNIGDQVKFNDNPQAADSTPPGMVYIDHPVAGKLKRNYKIFVGDGEVELAVEDIFGDVTTCEVVKGGVLKSHQTVYIPEILKQLKLPSISDKDKLGIEFAVQHDVDFIFVSHVECGHWIEEVRQLLGDAGKNIKIFAKIQNRFGVDEIEEILASSDGIVVAPTIDLQPKVMPFINRMVQRLCKQQLKLCLMTIENELETTEIYQAVNWMLTSVDGTVMTGTSSDGKLKPLESMAVLQNIRSLSEAFCNDEKLREVPFEVCSVEGALAPAVVTSSLTTKASAIILITESEQTVNLVYHHQPNCKVIVVISNKKAARQLNILDRITPLLLQGSKSLKLDAAISFARKSGLVKNGDTVIILEGEESRVIVHYLPYK